MTSESQEQINLFTWANLQACKIPELKLLFHIPNGGKRNIVTAKRLKAEGVKAGVPDLFLPVPRGGFHGLFIEMKAGKTKTTKKQDAWITDLRQQGYKAVVCYGCEQAMKEIKEYLFKNAKRRNNEKCIEVSWK